MKNKLFLLALPVLMALSGCSGVHASPKADLMVEDTLAHEEVFGAVEEAGSLGIKAPRMRASFGSDFIKMGYQINFDNKNNANDSDDTISIRFIAALKDANVKAFWHRGFAQPNGFEGVNKGSGNWEYKLEDNVYETGANALNIQSHKFYSSLTDGDTPITAKSGVYSEYEGFVIYTLRNIPYNDYKNAYLGVYLEVIDADNEEIKKNSDFAAVKVEKSSNYVSANYFSIDSTEYNNKYFLQGTMHLNALQPAEVSNLVVLDDTPTDGNLAQKADLAFAANDTFGIFRFATNHFQCLGYDQLRQCIPYTQRVSGSNYCKIATAGTYPIYVKEDGETHELNAFVPAPDSVKETTKLYLNPNSDWKSDGARFALYAFHKTGDVPDAEKWYDLEAEGDYYSVTFNASSYPMFIFCRMKSGTTENNWGNKWNQTSDLSLDRNMYNITGWDNSGNWSIY